MAMWEDVKRNLVEWYGLTTDKTVEVAKVTSRRYDKFGISRDIERQFSELGNLVYLGMKNGSEELLADPRVQALVERLDQLEQELQAKEEEITSIRNQHRHQKHQEGAATVETPEHGVDAAADSRNQEPRFLAESVEVEEPVADFHSANQQDEKNPG